jgi:hypothetical protein
MVAVGTGWWCHCEYNPAGNAPSPEYFLQGLVAILALFAGRFFH